MYHYMIFPLLGPFFVPEELWFIASYTVKTEFTTLEKSGMAI